MKYKHNLIKICQRQFRNPIYLAKEWREALEDKEFYSPSALARCLRVSRARVTQIMNLLELSPKAVQLIYSLGDPLSIPVVSERRLRPLLGMTVENQVE